MPEMTDPQGKTHEIVPAGVEALRSLGWTGADPEPEKKPRGRRTTAKASEED